MTIVLSLHLSSSAVNLLVEEGYDPAYGARPLKRVIQHKLVDALAVELLDGRIRDGDEVLIDAQDGELTFTVVEDEAVYA